MTPVSNEHADKTKNSTISSVLDQTHQFQSVRPQQTSFQKMGSVRGKDQKI